MGRRKEYLTMNIERLRKAIHTKYRQFKQGSLDTELEMEKQYKLIIQAIKTHEPFSVKQEIKEDDNRTDYDGEEADMDEESVLEFKPDVVSTPQAGLSDRFETRAVYTPRAELSIRLETDAISTPHAELSNFLQTDEGQANATQFLSDIPNDLTREYMEKMIRDIGGRTSLIDHHYGPRYEASTLMVGDSPLEFDDAGNIKLGGRSYKPTRGLYELLFKRTPDKDTYDKDDLRAYKDILVQTSAHKKDYLFRNKINRLTGSTKYKEVISKLFPLTTTTTGSGLVKSVSTRDISYWDDPNELCDRLRLLVASAETGNMGRGNEMLNIVEELREAGLIKGQGNKRFRSFLQ